MKSDTGGNRISADQQRQGINDAVSSDIRDPHHRAAADRRNARANALLAQLGSQVQAESPPEQQQAAVTVEELEGLAQKNPIRYRGRGAVVHSALAPRRGVGRDQNDRGKLECGTPRWRNKRRFGSELGRRRYN
jgi:hypothetical protein